MVAARVRQWELDERSHALRQVMEEEREAERRRAAARHALGAAHDDRAGRLAKEFRSADVIQSAAYEGGLRERADAAGKDLHVVQARRESTREHVQETLAQRDAYQKTWQSLSAAAERAQRAAQQRESDEMWSQQSAHRSSRHED